MKTATIPTLLILFLFSSATINNKEEVSLKITGSDILEKCIKHYDPNGAWDNYSGTVHLKTIWRNRNSEAKIEINNSTGFYQSTKLNSNEKIVKGTKNGECFKMINDNSDLTEEQIKEKNLTCESIRMMKEHHTCHFGFVMNMEKAGVKIDEEVAEESFNGWNCYVISFSGKENEVIHNYYVATGKLYIDKENYILRGKEVAHPDFPKRKIIYIGEINVNDISMPEVFVYYMNDELRYTLFDIFNVVEN